MHSRRRSVRFAGAALFVLGIALASSGCQTLEPTLNESELAAFATRYAAAWSSGDPAKLASFYTEDGSLIVNAGPPSVGRPAVEATARSFMAAFPDMIVTLESVRRDHGVVTFHWLWTDTNTGPGGTGRSVQITGFEEWTFGADGLIRESKGHYDEAEYQRQVGGAGDGG